VIFVDASAIVCVLLNEAEAENVMTLIEQRTPCVTSAMAVSEAGMAVARVSGLGPVDGGAVVLRFLERFAIPVAEIEDHHSALALRAAPAFGRHHRAKLNMGDCFAYAVAKSRDASILFVGDDFTHTDLPDALAGI
jgi:ribonuclease VapC